MAAKLLLLSVFASAGVLANRSFTIDYEADTFLLDGQPFRYVSGSLHYFRIPPELWQDRLKKARAGGFNAIQFVVPWNIHERRPGQFDFNGINDVFTFIEMAHDEGLYVLLRPGPYICAEHNGGGLPFWLYQMYPDIKLRSSDSNFLAHVDKWWAELLPRIRSQMYINGGNILMVQLENEYGSYGLQTQNCDIEYMLHLHDLVESHLGPDVIMYTTDGNGDGYLRCGQVPGAYITVDFGPGANVNESFIAQRHFQPHGPLVNSEFYPGWLDYWGQPHNTVGANESAVSLNAILATGANVNVYMAHGGTSFGFGSGTNTPPFSVEPTSYDYDAPISEAGDLTPKYFAFKEVIKNYLDIPDINITTSPKGNYGQVSMKYVSSFFVANGTLLRKTGESQLPLSFEQMGQENGFVLYQTSIPKLFPDPAKLEIIGLHDRGYVFVNKMPQGILSRAEGVTSMPLTVDAGDSLQILLENQGRVGYGPNAKDFKGIVSNVTLNSETLENWSMYSLPFNDTKAILKYVSTLLDIRAHDRHARKKLKNDLDVTDGKGSFWYGEFMVPCNDSNSLDTFLSFPNGWSKGHAFVNDKHIGRYWPRVGPQMTLYVPGVWLNKPCQMNTVILFEQERPGCQEKASNCYVELVNQHDINGPTPVHSSSNMLPVGRNS